MNIPWRFQRYSSNFLSISPMFGHKNLSTTTQISKLLTGCADSPATASDCFQSKKRWVSWGHYPQNRNVGQFLLYFWMHPILEINFPIFQFPASQEILKSRINKRTYFWNHQALYGIKAPLVILHPKLRLSPWEPPNDGKQEAAETSRKFGPGSIWGHHKLSFFS